MRCASTAFAVQLSLGMTAVESVGASSSASTYSSSVRAGGCRRGIWFSTRLRLWEPVGSAGPRGSTLETPADCDCEEEREKRGQDAEQCLDNLTTEREPKVRWIVLECA